MITKEEILEAIKKTTRKNGGISLGINRFEDETGIKENEWDRYWPRFSDAQKEAGVKPNTFGITSFTDKEIFEQFILLTRELGRIPITGELKVRHTYDASFPSIAVFQRLFGRLGGIQNCLSELLKYAENKNYKDVVKLCQSRLEKVKKIEVEDGDVGNEPFEYVYLGKRGYHYKVGVTKDLPRRKTQLETLQPEDFEYLHVIKTDDPYKIEAYWKDRFNPKLIKNTKEWFKLNSADVKAFKRWKRIF